MEFFADWHTHSKYSDGRGSIEQNVVAALNGGLDEIAITDHGPANISAGVKGIHSYNLVREEVKRINEKYPQIRVKTGAEADITDLEGTIDLPVECADSLDVLIVGLHPYVWPATLDAAWSLVVRNQTAQVSRGSREKVRTTNTKALKEAVNRYNVDFISHPDLQMPVDVGELSKACAAQGTAIEINTGHLYDKTALVRIAAKTGVDFVVNSDAHFPETVGHLEEGGRLLEKFNIPVQRVLNARDPKN